MQGSGFNSIKQSFSESIHNIVSLQLNEASDKISDMLETRNNQPVEVTINLTSRKLAYKIKKELKQQSTVSDIVSQNNSIKFHAKSDDPLEFFYEVLLPIFEDKLKISIDEKLLIINGKNIKIDTNGKKIRTIFI